VGPEVNHDDRGGVFMHEKPERPVFLRGPRNRPGDWALRRVCLASANKRADVSDLARYPKM